MTLCTSLHFFEYIEYKCEPGSGFRLDSVHEGQGNAGDLRHLHHTLADGGPDDRASVLGEAVEAGVGVGERGADPGLHVAEVPGEAGAPGAPQPPHLRHRLAELVDAVLHSLHAVFYGPGLTGPRTGRRPPREGRGRPRLVHAHGEGGQRHPARAPADGQLVGREAALAEARVLRDPARRADEVAGAAHRGRGERTGGGEERRGD
ncbi:unnamed protein product [Musa acuminata subsp. burmannicoides]